MHASSDKWLMWQHLVNALLGIILLTVAFLATSIGAVSMVLGGALGIAGLAVTLNSIWGFFDDEEQRTNVYTSI